LNSNLCQEQHLQTVPRQGRQLRILLFTSDR
jgi:hypothetical protein